MDSKWSDSDAASYIRRYAAIANEDVALRVYTSQLIGQDPSLVLHGGGNTSVKTQLKDDLGEWVDVLCVKGSGWDLGNIEPAGLPALRLEPLMGLRKRASMSDEEMVNAQRIRMLDASAPNPSVETLLHAFIRDKFIDHSHADAILALVDQPEAERICRDRFGDRLAIVPYIMPGFALAKLAAEVYEANPACEGLLLLQHGLFTFGSSAKQSYERHIQAVSEAEDFASRRRYWSTRNSMPPMEAIAYETLAPMLRGMLESDGRKYVLSLRRTPEILGFVNDGKMPELSQVGCATPDHVIRTKRFPLVLRLDPGVALDRQRSAIEAALEIYRAEYRSYVERQATRKGINVRPLDPDPRVILVPDLGMITVGATPKAAGIVADIYEHTITVIRHAEAVGQYQALPEDDIFDMEYWSLEQAKLGKASPPPLAGTVVVISGAASGIGEATARTFAKAGASLYLLDRNESELRRVSADLGADFAIVDVSNEAALRTAVGHAVTKFGGIDGVVSNAGVAPQAAIASCDSATLRKSFDVNFFSHQVLAQAVVAVMRKQGRGGFLLFNASKAAFNPGADFGPYALPKAALVALMKQYALELGKEGIRSNAVNADRIRTALLNADDIKERARARGLTADDYYRSNLLQTEVMADDVAAAFLHLAQAEKTTGAVLTVDGGNIAASPR